MENQMATRDLIYFAKESMKKAGYSADYISALSKTWSVLRRYLSEKNIPCYSSSAGNTLLKDLYNICPDRHYCKLSGTDKRRKRAILILNNCMEHNTLFAPSSYHDCNFSKRFEEKFQMFIDLRIKQGFSLSTINGNIYCLNRLSDYLVGLDIQLLDEINSAHIVGFMKKQSIGGKIPTLKNMASCLRLFLKFLYSKNYISRNLSLFVPKVKSRPYKIPSVYTKDEIQKMLSCIDRSGPKGKRDFAMILLATRLGMRASDICGLKFRNLKWHKDTIEFVTKKTGASAILPLSGEVGEAIIEYLKYGRPDSEDRHIFLRMQIPLTKMQPSALHFIVSKALRKADIPLLPGKHHGPHALRASLASAMLDKNISLPVISEALTHKSTDTTRNYLKIDTRHLREYSLEVQPLGDVWMGGVRRWK